MFPSEPLPDSIGPYTIVRRIASRGEADLFLGNHAGPMGFRRECVLKLVPSASGDPSLAAELAQEAKICSKLNHPAIVRMFDFFENGDQLVLVTEHFAGVSLARILSFLHRRTRRMPDDAVWYLAHRLFGALAHAHALVDEEGRPSPVVHRDISPSHVIVSADANVRLAGFGIAKIEGSPGTTAIGFVKGTPAYMAPEQAAGEKVSERADVYAAGLVTWEMLSGKTVSPPGDLSYGTELLRLIAGRRFESIAEIRRDIPREVAAAVDACLVPQVDRRTIRCRDVERWLEKLVNVDNGKRELRECLAQLQMTNFRSVSDPTADQTHPFRAVPSRFPGLAKRVSANGTAANAGLEATPSAARSETLRLPSYADSIPKETVDTVSTQGNPAEKASNLGNLGADAKAGATGVGVRVDVVPIVAPGAAASRGASGDDADGSVVSSDSSIPEDAEISALVTEDLDEYPGEAVLGGDGKNRVIENDECVFSKPSPVVSSTSVHRGAECVRDSVAAAMHGLPSPRLNCRQGDNARSSVSDGLGVSGPSRSLRHSVGVDSSLLSRGLADMPERLRPVRAKRWHANAIGVALGFVLVVSLWIGGWLYSRVADGGAAGVASGSRGDSAGGNASAFGLTEPGSATGSVSARSTGLASGSPSGSASSSKLASGFAGEGSGRSVEDGPGTVFVALPDGLSVYSGALLVKAPPEGTVFSNGRPIGKTGVWIPIPACNRWTFVRVGAKPGELGNRERDVMWLAPGQSVSIPCGKGTEIVGTPR